MFHRARGQQGHLLDVRSSQVGSLGSVYLHIRSSSVCSENFRFPASRGKIGGKFPPEPEKINWTGCAHMQTLGNPPVKIACPKGAPVARVPGGT